MKRVNATRMELLKLRKNIEIAERGHKLLEDKRDELMRKFRELAIEVGRRREEVERKIAEVYQTFLTARSLMNPEMLEEALMLPKIQLRVEVSTKSIMGVKVPEIEVKTEGGNGIISYGLYQVPSELDRSLETLSNLVPELIKLAEMEKSIELLSFEIEKTRRRVNALEHVVIPEMKKSEKLIALKLGEMERSYFATLKRIVERLRGEEGIVV